MRNAKQCLRHGADVAINYKAGPFAPKVRAATNDRGCRYDSRLIGAAYLAQNLEALANGGALVLIGLMKGAKAEIDLATVLRRHLRIIGSTLRTRPPPKRPKSSQHSWHDSVRRWKPGSCARRSIKRSQLSDAAEAHRMMQASEHFGKIVLQVS